MRFLSAATQARNLCPCPVILGSSRTHPDNASSMPASCAARVPTISV